MITAYCRDTAVTPARLADHYLWLVNIYRIEAVYFFEHGSYRCKNQAEADAAVYSNREIMEHYMYALLLTQVLWQAHFDTYLYLTDRLEKHIKTDTPTVLEIGPGHGFFSRLINNRYPSAALDLVDISAQSLEMSRKMVGEGERIRYINGDVFEFGGKYDLIILGEVLEHLDSPRQILRKISELLSERGILWITVPTNSPAPDHVYLFSSRSEVLAMIEESGLSVIESGGFPADGFDEQTANERKLTVMVGAFCTPKTTKEQ
ncbi:SAM-dependent methyltransferase [Campylobacterota bacterium]|nr:SAM-dependent methyltransferase [Campylobacterota bacterium]